MLALPVTQESHNPLEPQLGTSDHLRKPPASSSVMQMVLIPSMRTYLGLNPCSSLISNSDWAVQMVFDDRIAIFVCLFCAKRATVEKSYTLAIVNLRLTDLKRIADGLQFDAKSIRHMVACC